MNKYYLLGAALVIFLASAFGAVSAFSRPALASVQEKVNLLNYEQQGTFGYEAKVRPGAFYGGESAAEGIPQIPISYIERFDMDFSFTSNKDASRLVSIDARVESPGVWAKTVNVAARKSYTGNFRIPFSLDLGSYQELADAINKEMGGYAGTAYTVTLVASVNGEGGLVQALPIRVTKSVVDIDDGLLMSQGGSAGKFEYRVKLKDNILYGPVTLTPPPSLLDPTLITLGPSDTVLTRLLESMTVNYDYRLTADKSITSQSSRVKITAVLDSAGVWSKDFVLVPETTVNGPVHLSFPLDVAYYSGLFDDIQKEVGGGGTGSLTLTASVHTEAQTEGGLVVKDFSQAMKTDLKKSVLAWDGLKKTEPGTMEGSRVVMVDNKLLRMPVSQARVIFGVLAGLALVVFAYAMIKTPFSGAAAGEGLVSKYKDIIVEAGEMPASRESESVVKVSSLDDLIKTSQGLLKPVLHHGVDGKQMYWISDGNTRYQYLEISTPKKKAGRV